MNKMVFDNLDQIVEYIRSVVTQELPSIGEEMKEIMNTTLMQETGYDSRTPNMYERTGGMKEIVTYEQFGDKEIDGVFQDNGRWVDKHGRHYFPLNRWEEGKVWAPGYNSNNKKFYPKTNIVENSAMAIDMMIPIELRERLRARGLKVL